MIAFPGCQVLDLAGPVEALEKANQAHATPLYKIEVVGTKRGTLKTSGALPRRGRRSAGLQKS
jgi:transcriptional regulator GlxA family with amidase domain